MTLQQLRYVIEVATSGSMTAAAARLYMAQPSLSKAIAELEQELGITIFERTPTGVVVTDDGERFLVYANGVVEQADKLEARYKGTHGPRPVFSVSSPHNVLVTRAFAEVVRAHGREFQRFALREERVATIVESVRTQRSEVGVLYRSSANRDLLESTVDAAELSFEPVATVHPVALVASSALREIGHVGNSGQLIDLPQVVLPSMTDETIGRLGRIVRLPKAHERVVASDWETALDLVVRLGGYTVVIGGVGPSRSGISPVHLPEFRPVELGVVTRTGFPLSPAAHDFSTFLRELEV